MFIIILDCYDHFVAFLTSSKQNIFMTTGITAQALIIKYFSAGNMPAAMFVLAPVD